jgi:hypothetical protein
MHVVLNLFGHGEDDDVLDVVEIQPFGCNAGRDHYVFSARFEGLDGVLTLFLRCGQGEESGFQNSGTGLALGTVNGNGFDTFQ